jgi:signal transduction histidine kinase
LVALAVSLQLAEPLLETSTGAKELIEDMKRDVQQALDEATQLAQRIYPPLPDAGGLAATLRWAAANFGIPASVEVNRGLRYPPEVGWTVYLCWLEALEHAGIGTHAAVSVQDEAGALTFEVFADIAGSQADFDRLRDRVEALGGWLVSRSEGRAIRVSCSLPLSR